MLLHLILIIMQLPFILSVPFWLMFPLWSVVGGVAVFLMINQSICFLLNGSDMEVESKNEYAERKKEHEHEQWIFLNGVAVGYVSPRMLFLWPTFDHVLTYVFTDETGYKVMWTD